MNLRSQFKSKISLILKYKYPIILLLIWVFICLNNFTPNTYLTGWDNLHPEFDYSMNLKRLLTSSWAEYQGLGAPGAHSHASEIPRMFIIGILNLFLSSNLIRYVFIFATLIIGTLGIYIIVRKIFLKRKNENLKDFSAFAAALFYMLNVGTVQHFIVPFEMFNVQYALLPWLIYYAIRFLENKKFKYLLIFAILTFFSAPMAYAVMLWIAYFGGLTIFLLLNLIIQRDKKLIKPSIFLFVVTILVNLFWLIPNLYFVFNHSNYVPTAKTNLIFSEEAFLTNQKYGNILDIFLNKGFLFDWQIRNTNYTFEPILGKWDEHIDNPIVRTIALLCFALIVLGIIYSIYRKQKYLMALTGILVFTVIVLMGTNPPFGGIWEFLVARISVLQEAIRFPFTKFSILFIFAQTAFLSAGVYAASRFITLKLNFTGGKFVSILFLLLVSIIYSWPTFQGNFINKSLRINIPEDYFQTFNFFKEQNKTERIANFPVNTLFGWFYTDWGYQGSGFLWYGIEQPILDRDFDRWYTTLENYYDEISSAVYTNNESALKEVFNKYAIDWIIIDEHVVSSSENANFVLNPDLASSEMAYKETKTLLEKIPEVQHIETFGKIHIYKIDNLNLDKSYIEVLSPNTQGAPIESKSLFLADNFGRKTKESNFRKLNNEYVEYNNNIYTLTNNEVNLQIPQIFNVESSIPASVNARMLGTSLNVKLIYQVPSIEVNGKPIFNVVKTRNFDFPLTQISNSYYLVLDNQVVLLDNLDNALQHYGYINISTKEDLVFKVFSGKGEDITTRLDLEKAQINNCNAKEISRSSSATFNDGILTLRSTGENICIDFTLNTLNSVDSLYNLQMDYRSNQGVTGDACIKFEAGCVNTKQFRSEYLPTFWYPFNTFAENADSNRVGLSIVLNNAIAENTASISYRNIQFTKYSLETSATLTNEEVKRDLNISQDLIEVKPANYKLSVKFTIPWNRIYNFDYRDLQQIIPLSSKDCKPYIDTIELDRNLDAQNKQINFISVDGFNCENINLYNINLKNGFLLNLEGENKEGPGLVLNISDFFYKKVYYTNRLPEEGTFNEILTIPNLIDTKVNGLNVFINNQSVGNRITINSIKNLSVSPIIYSWLSSIELLSKEKYINDESIITAEKITTASYKANITPSSGNRILKFNQSFESNWLAYDNKGNLLERYGDININTEKSEWNNYWILPAGTTGVYIEYRTQTYQYFAFLVVSITFILLSSASLYQSRRFKGVREVVNKRIKRLIKRRDLFIERIVEPRVDKYKKFNKKDLS